MQALGEEAESVAPRIERHGIPAALHALHNLLTNFFIAGCRGDGGTVRDLRRRRSDRITDTLRRPHQNWATRNLDAALARQPEASWCTGRATRDRSPRPPGSGRPRVNDEAERRCVRQRPVSGRHHAGSGRASSSRCSRPASRNSPGFPVWRIALAGALLEERSSRRGCGCITCGSPRDECANVPHNVE